MSGDHFGRLEKLILINLIRLKRLNLTFPD